jgi:rod shape-determining protein MreD
MIARALLIFFLLSLASVLDVTFAPRVALCFAKPSFVIVLVTILAVYSPPLTASYVGFLAGLMAGGLANENMSAHVVSLTLMAYGVSRFFPLAVARTRTAVALMALGGSLGASLVFLLFVPERHILWWFRDTIGDAGYNALLTWLLCPIGRGITRVGSRR